MISSDSDEEIPALTRNIDIQVTALGTFTSVSSFREGGRGRGGSEHKQGAACIYF